MRKAAAIVLLAVAPVVLPAAAGAYTFPAGKQGDIVFTAEDASQRDIWKMNADGTGPVNLTNTPALDEVDPVYSASGRRIYFARAAGDGQADIWVMNADGTGALNLTNTPAPVDEFRAAPSPDGRSLAFALQAGGSTDIYRAVIDPQTAAIVGTPAPLTATPASDELDPAWTPDGRSLFVFRGDATMEGIIRLDPRTGAVLNGNVTSPPAATADLYPAVSPDGERLTFSRLDGGTGNFEVLTVALDGSGARNLTNSAPPGLELTPRFLADGSGIVFTHRDAGAQFDIYSMKADGSSPRPLTSTATLDEQDPAVESIQRCGKRRATIVGDDGPDKIRGTKKADVIVANAGKDTVRGRGGNDRICLGKGKDKVVGGGGEDRCIGGKGNDDGKGCERGKL